MLLLDDIQFIVGKESTQEELFHTFNYLHTAGKQVIFTSDCPPPRYRPRGAPAQPLRGWLDHRHRGARFRNRVAILQTKVERQGMQVNYDVLMLIADRVKSNVRELEGALNRVWLYRAESRTSDRCRPGGNGVRLLDAAARGVHAYSHCGTGRNLLA